MTHIHQEHSNRKSKTHTDTNTKPPVKCVGYNRHTQIEMHKSTNTCKSCSMQFKRDNLTINHLELPLFTGFYSLTIEDHQRPVAPYFHISNC